MKIYKIIDNTNDAIYIGKTIQSLNQRLSQHESSRGCSSKKIIENGDYKIELIEETEDESRERYWIESTECINKQIPGRSKREYYENNKEKRLQQMKQYRDKNKEKNKQYKKEYMREYNKEYRKVNKEKTKEYNKEYRKYRNSFGGDPRFDNNLLKINPDLFT